jgi:PBP1b-binding outer membrane lipoprotein LpoB
MKSIFITLFAVLFLTGCASNTAKDYYSAVEKTARANADAHNAKMNALAIMAQNADPSAQGAAVMAIALSQTPTVVPQYVESNALKWASIIVPSVSNLGGLAIQANVAKNASDNSKEIQLATQSTNQAIQLGNQQMVSGLINGNSLAAQGTTDALVTLGVAGINAVNLAGEQTVSVAETGFSTVQNIVLDNNQLITDLNGSYNDTIETFVFNPLQPLVVEPFIVEPVIVPSM